MSAVIMLLLFTCVCNGVAQTSSASANLHSYVKEQLRKSGIRAQNATIIVRFDEGSSCTACYAHQGVADSLLVSRMERAGATILLVRFLVVRRGRDFESAARNTLDTRSIVLPDVGAQGAKACRAATKGAMQAILRPDGKTETLTSQ